MKIPIIYSPHKIGLKKNSLDFLFVPISLASVVNSNPNTDIFFLNVNKDYKVTVPEIKDVDATSFYAAACSTIREFYQHLSTNDSSFELFCMERFFVIKEFMKLNSIDKAFLVETDVLVFQNLNSFLSLNGGINPNQTHLSERKCISLGYVTLSYLEHYCDYIVSCYRDGEKFKKIEQAFHNYREKGGMGGICDMTFCDYINNGMYGSDQAYTSENISKIVNNNIGKQFLFDSFIGRDFVLGMDKKIIMAESYIDKKKIKRIDFDDGRPKVTFDDHSEVQLGSIHCQGNAKGLMADYFVKTKFD